MVSLETYSQNDGERILREKGVLDEIHQMPALWAKYRKQSDYSDLKAAMEELGGWQTEVQIDLGPNDTEHQHRLTPFLDAYHPAHRVAVEHERKEQMRARWHLMKTQAASERSATLPIEATVLIFPTDKDPSLRRTRRELEGPFFKDHFPIHIPVYAVEYSRSDSK